MKVIHSCTSKSFSGLEAYVLDLVAWQYRAGHDVELFCREDTQLEQAARAIGIPVWTIGAEEKPGLRLWRRLFRQWQQRLRASDLVLHMHAGGEPRYHFWTLMRRPRRLRKAILHYHLWINHKKTDLWHRALFLGVDEIWTSSESSRAHLAALLPVPRERMRVVPYGRDVAALTGAPISEWRRETRARLGVGDDDMLAACISRIEPIKGTDELVAAFEKIAPSHPNAHLVLVGDASPANTEAAVLAAAIRRRHEAMDDDVARRLHLPGFVSPCEPFLAAADFYVLPSYEECMSLAMLDAAVLGLPIVGTNAGGTPSVARPGETGLLVPARDSHALGSAMASLFGDPALCCKLGGNARELGRQFDRQEIFARIWDWYGTFPPTTI